MNCVFCATACTPTSLLTGPNPRDASRYDCQICGAYELPNKLSSGPPSFGGKKKLIIGALRHRHEQGFGPFVIGDYSTAFEGLFESTPFPRDVLDSMDLVLLHLCRHVRDRDLRATVNAEHDYPVAFVESPNAYLALILALIEDGMLKRTNEGSFMVQVTTQGWARARVAGRDERKSYQAFIAMAFGASTDAAYADGIKPALEHVGYRPVRIDKTQHNEKICDQIIAEIRRSGLVVADFTCNRAGVYYEAGFAQGLNIPVVRSCAKSDVDKLHFDTRQYNHIVWETAPELRDQLVARIEALYPVKR